jgi:hypothetical protein
VLDDNFEKIHLLPRKKPNRVSRLRADLDTAEQSGKLKRASGNSEGEWRKDRAHCDPEGQRNKQTYQRQTPGLASPPLLFVEEADLGDSVGRREGLSARGRGPVDHFGRDGRGQRWPGRDHRLFTRGLTAVRYQRRSNSIVCSSYGTKMAQTDGGT